jgi:hypothetical protein
MTAFGGLGAVSIWHEAPGEYLVDLSRYSLDYQVMVQQLVDDEGLELPGDFRSAIVSVEPLEPALRLARRSAGAAGGEPDWDRYTWDAVQALVDRKLLPPSAAEEHDSPATWRMIQDAGLDEDRAYRVGFVRYVASIAQSLLLDDMPPVIFVDGVLADGNHRVLAASWAGMSHVPILHLTEPKP